MNRLRQLRKEKGLTLIELSEKVNLNKSSLSRYEIEEVTINSDVLKMLADFYDVTIDYIMGYTNERKPRDYAQINGTKLALFNQINSLSEAEMKDVLRFVEFTKSRNGE